MLKIDSGDNGGPPLKKECGFGEEIDNGESAEVRRQTRWKANDDKAIWDMFTEE